MFRAIALATAAAFAAGAHAATQWHMPTPYPDGEHHTRNVRAFAADVAAATGGELEIVVHSGASLFKHPEIHRAVRGGQVPIGEMLMGLLGNDDPLFKADNVPFLATDFESARRLWRASRTHVETALDAQGLMLLYAVPWPPQGLYAKKSVASAADIAGARLRVYSPLTARLAEALRAEPVTVQTPEIPQAFGTGMIDMMFTSATTGVSTSAWDFVDHYINARAWIPKNMVIVNKRAFRRLSAEQQRALLAAADAAEKRGWEMAERETREKTAALAAHGITVSAPSAELEAGLRAAGRALAEEWARETGPRARDILEAMED